MVVYEGNVVNVDSEIERSTIEIDDSGIIKSVSSHSDDSLEMADVVFGDDCFIFPGMGDIHIHAREDQTGDQCYKEEYRTAGNAALNGGVVHVSTMPNTLIPLTRGEHFDWHRDRIKELHHPVSMLNYVGIGEGTRPIGAPGDYPYKAFFGKSVGDLTFYDEHELEDALQHYRGHDVSFHVEYEPIIETHADGLTHSDRRPVSAVNEGLRLLLPLIEKYEINAKLCHWSTGGDSFDMINEHRYRATQQGLPYTTVEVSPLHLLFDTSMTDIDPSLWLKIQMNPAIQTPEHREALLEGLRSGFIDYLATDHAPHTLEEKHTAFRKFHSEFPKMSNEEIANHLSQMRPDLFKKTCCENGMSGAPWLDTYAAVTTKLMDEYGFTPQDIACVTGFNPGVFVNQYLDNQFSTYFGKGFGRIAPGYVGSLTVINTKTPHTVSRSNLQTKVGWSPLEGMSFPGGLEAIIIRGRDVTGQFREP